MLHLLREHAESLSARVGAPIEVRRVLVRDLAKARVAECDPALLTTDPDDILGDDEIDVVVEVMGGVDQAKSLVSLAIERGKSVVTANKMLLAMHGPSLIEAAVESRVDLAFEGAVGGGIPIIRTLREAFAGDSVESLVGIVNGTCNYVLTNMRERGDSLADAIAEAQAKGYAEADPSLDVDGHDAAHKLVVLAMLAFGATVDHSAVSVDGIRRIDEIDHRFAERFGYIIKHLAIGRDRGGSIELRVHPTLIPNKSVLANVSGSLNAILVDGRALGPCLVSGRGAGDLPTAVSVVADIVDVGRSIVFGVAGLQTRAMRHRVRPLRPMEDIESRYYVRFTVADRPGVMASLAGALGSAGVSIEQIVQQGLPTEDGGPVDVVMITHRAREGDVVGALEVISRDGSLVGAPRLFHIEDIG